MTDILQTDKVVKIFVTLVAGAISEGRLKPTQSQMSLVVSDIVLKNKFAIKGYETVLYT